MTKKKEGECLPGIVAVAQNEGRTFSNWSDLVSWVKNFNVYEGMVHIGYEEIMDYGGVPLMSFPLNYRFIGSNEGYKEELENLYHDIGRFLGIEN